MKVLIDTNVYISYLLVDNPENTCNKIINYLIDSETTILLPPHQEEELYDKLRSKKTIATFITAFMAGEFVQKIEARAKKIDKLEKITPITRDPKDDYLLAYSVEHLVDYLITGDHDLLILKNHLSTPQIVTPQEFLNIIKTHS